MMQWSDEFQGAWNHLPKGTRTEIERALRRVPGGLKGWRELIDLAAEHFRLAAGTKRKVAIVGPANVGKSTLYNALIRPEEKPAEVSAVPGTTREVQAADAGVFAMIDTPGTDAEGEGGQADRQKALLAASSADLMVLVFDASHGVRNPERALYQELSALGVPMIVALNKMDLVGEEHAAVTGRAIGTLKLRHDEVIPISALHREGLEDLLLAMVRKEPEVLVALAEELPAYRRKLAQTVIVRGASAAGAIGFTPLPIIDFIPLLGIQITMVLGIARVYAYRISLARARELIATFGFGAVGRLAFYELSKLGGPPTWLLSAGIAAGTTAALGYAAVTWFESGRQMSNAELRALMLRTSQTMMERLKALGRRRPRKTELKGQLGEALEDLPMED
ncbi:MAG: GTP-binding protein [Acidobacteriota bacterium]